MSLTAFACLLCLPAGLLGGCATSRPGTGDISFRLLWQGTADLDLHVEGPHGRHVGTHMNWVGVTDPAERNRQFAEYMRLDEELSHLPKGILDIDCNADPERMCKQPIENIFWPKGTAPRGVYQVWVHHFQNVEGRNQPGDGAVDYRLEIRRGETVIKKVPGTVEPEAPTSERIEVEY